MGGWIEDKDAVGAQESEVGERRIDAHLFVWVGGWVGGSSGLE